MRRVAVAGVVAVVLLVAVAVAVAVALGRPDGSTSAGRGGAPNGSPTGAVDPSSGPSAPKLEVPADTPGASHGSGPGEVNGGQSAGPLPGLPSASPRARVRVPAHAAAARGRLVDGYPRRLVPVPHGTRITSSSVSPSGRRLQATVVATYGGSRHSLVRFYRRALSRAGMPGAESPALRGATSYSFSDGRSAVTLTVAPRQARGLPFTLFLAVAA